MKLFWTYGPPPVNEEIREIFRQVSPEDREREKKDPGFASLNSPIDPCRGCYAEPVLWGDDTYGRYGDKCRNKMLGKSKYEPS